MTHTTPRAIRQADELVYRVSERAYRYLRRHGDIISVRYAAIEAEVAEITAAEQIAAAYARLTRQEMCR